METMKAIRIHKFGGPDVLKYESALIPSIKDNEVLIKIHAAGVNPVDWKIREGYFKENNLPLILGWDLSGEIVNTGKAVSAFKKGDLVYAHPALTRDGTDAEYIAVPVNEIAKKPASLKHLEAAVVPLAALTAWQALFDVANLAAGQRVLIHAAAGGVGHFAVQLAKWKGAEVIGTASEKNKQFLLELGVNTFIDYQRTPFEKAVKEVDVVLDTVGGETQDRSWSVLKKNGILVTIVDPARLEEQAKKYQVRGQFHLVSPNGDELSKIAQLIDQGKIKPHISATFPLKDAAKAQQLSREGHVKGKIALIVVD